MKITEIIREKTNENNFVSAVLIGLSKAFNSVNRTKLITELVRLGLETA